MGCFFWGQVMHRFGLFAFSRAGDWQGMKEEQQRFLALLGQLPLRLTAEQAGWVLNCQAHDIPALVNARMLKPLGNPSQNSTKYFATADVLEMAKDRVWLVKVTNAISQHWQKQNARKNDAPFNGARNGHVSLMAAS
jgi:hypothetical protein